MNPLRQNLLIAVTSVLLLLAGLEVFARVVLGVKPRVEQMQLHHQLGWVWTPGYDAVETYFGVNYRLKISSQGLRNEEITVPKPLDTYRVIALGDSITEGPGVELDQTFAKQLEQLLRDENPERTIEVINAGIGDYSTEQELIWLRERGLAFDPDLLLLNVYLNDARGFKTPSAAVAVLNNFFSSRSAVYFFYLSQFRGHLIAKRIASPEFRFRFGEFLKSETWVTDSDALTHVIQEANQDWGMAWDDQKLAHIEDRLKQIIQLTNEHRISLLLIVFPVNVQVYTQVETPLGLERPQQALTAFAQSQSVPMLDLLPLFRKHRDGNLFYDQAHLIPEAHRIVAETLFQTLHEYELLSFP